jgi:hypothetical protein
MRDAELREVGTTSGYGRFELANDRRADFTGR